MKITIAQMEVIPKKCEENFNTIQALVASAKQAGSNCIIFPELAVSGYLLGDLWYSDAFVEHSESYNEKIRELSQDIIIVWGNVVTSLNNNQTHTDGRQALYNSALMAYNQEYVVRENGENFPYVKQLLPNYRIFDDERYFVSGLIFDHALMHSPFVVTMNNKITRIGLEICEDMWNEHYSFNPTKTWAKNNVDVLINISSSPWTKNKEVAREKYIVDQATTYQIPYFVYVNAVGMQNTGKNLVLFDGGSCAVNHQGEFLARANCLFNSEKLTFDLDSTPSIKNEVTNKLYQALVFAIKKFDEQLFSPKMPWVIGLSGGIDSTVSAALLTKALGPEKVIAVNMPSRYNLDKTINNAKQTAKALNIEYLEHSIEPLMDATKSTLNLHEDVTESLILENAQARLRGHLLSTIAAMVGGIIANNGNKVETALGYATLYGDTIGALAILGDCTKIEVFELAKTINDDFGQEVVPVNLIPTIDEDGIHFDLKPTAELRANQIDPMKWGYHDRIIEMITEYPTYQLHHFINQVKTNTLDDPEMKKYLAFYDLTNFEEFINDIRWIVRQVQLAVFKRIQSPPIILVSRGAFGSDLRENQGMLPTNELFL